MDFKEFEKKSNKEKCIIMWEYLVENNKGDESNKRLFFKDKFNFCNKDISDLAPLNSCYACKEAESDELGNPVCVTCPVKWVEDQEDKADETYCELCQDSPYAAYINAPTKENAIEVLNIIKETWV